MSPTRVFIYVQYLEGIGHAVRTSRIAEALARQGAVVTLVFGGEPVPGLAPPSCQIVQLPALRATPESYSRLLKPDGAPVDAGYRAGRRETLLAAFEAATEGSTMKVLSSHSPPKLMLMTSAPLS